MSYHKIRSIILYTAVVLVLLWGLAIFTGGSKDQVAYSTVLTYFRQGQVVSFVVDEGGTLTMELADGTSRRHALADVEAFRQDAGPLYLEQYERGVLKSYDFRQRYEMPLWLVVLIPSAASAALSLNRF